MLGPWLDSILTGAIELVKTATSRSEPSVLEWHRGSCQFSGDSLLGDTDEIAKVEQFPKMEGRLLTMVVAPK